MKRNVVETATDQVKRPRADSDPSGRSSTGGKQPVAKPPASTPQRTGGTTGGKHPPSGTGGKQPTTAAIAAGGAGRGVKQPGGAGKEPGKTTTGGKQPTAYPPGMQRNTPQRPAQPPARQQASPRPNPTGVGGKQPYQQVLAEPEEKQPKQKPQAKNKQKQTTVQQPSTSPRSKAGTGRGRGAGRGRGRGSGGRRGAGRPPSQSPSSRARQSPKQHPYVGKRVKVYYIDEGYHIGTIKSVNDREFIIHWDEGSTSGVTLNEEDETEDAENEDRWSVVADSPYEQTTNGLQKARGGGNAGGPSYEDEEDT